MERLTEKRDGQWVIPLRQDGKRRWALTERRGAASSYLYGDHANCLAAYEDTGLMPDDVTDLMAAHGTAIGALAEYRAIGTVKDLRALIEAPPNNPLTPEELRGMDGEPVVFPCKIRDLMYEVDKPEYGVITCRVLYINYYAGPAGHVPGNPMVSTISIGVEVISGHGKGSSYCFEQEDIGKLVFLTRQEAEGAILACRHKPEEG